MLGNRYTRPSIEDELLATIYKLIITQNVAMSMLVRLLEAPHCHPLRNLCRALNQALDPDPGAAALKEPARCSARSTVLSQPSVLRHSMIAVDSRPFDSRLMINAHPSNGASAPPGRS